MRRVPLGEIAASHNGAIAIGPFGSAMKADTYSPSGVPVIRGTNISNGRAWKGDWVFVPEAFADRMPRCTVRAGDLVLPHRGSIGEVAIIPDDHQERYILSSSLMKITIDSKQALPIFVYYYLRSADGRHEIMKYASQVGTPGIGQPLQSLRQVVVPLPPLADQKEIAAILGALDDKIDLNRRMDATLEAMARAIFKDWFVDFGPTRAKMEGRAPYLAPEIWSLFPDRLDEEGKPQGWKTGTLADYAALNPESWSRANFPPRIAYVDLSNTKWGTIESVEALDRDKAPSRAQRVLRAGDTIVGTVRPGNGSYALVSRAGLTGSTGFAVLRPSRPVHREIVYLAATAPDNIDRLSHLADGAAYPAVRSDIVLDTRARIPGNGVVKAFHDITASLIDRIAANQAEAETLAQTRDLLLPKLMSGELRVQAAERAVEAVA